MVLSKNVFGTKDGETKRKMEPQISKLSAFQLDVHGIGVEGGKLVYRTNIQTESLFQPAIDVLMHYDYFPEEMKATVNGKTLKVDANMDHDNLLAMAMRRIIPNIRVTDEYKDTIQICLSENLVSNSIPIVEMKWGKISSKHQARIYDYMMEHVIRRNNRFLSHISGNRKELIEWGTYIPSCKAETIIPWYWYRGGTATSLPLFLKRDEQLSFILSFVAENSIKRFIRMRKVIVTPGGKRRYEYIRFNPKCITIDDQKIFETPVITGFYIKRLSDDTGSVLRRGACFSGKESFRIEYPFEDISQVGESLIRGYNNPATFEVKNDFITKSVIIFVENIEAANYGCYSNYSTNPIDPSRGDYPVSSVTLKDESAITERTYDVATILSMMSIHFQKSPRKPGILMIPLTIRPCEVEDANGKALAMNNIKIIVNLEDQTPGTHRDQTIDPEDTGPRYNISVYLQTWRKHVFTYDNTQKIFNHFLV